MYAGSVLHTRLDPPTYATARQGEVSAVDAITTHDAETGDLVVFAVNRDQHEPVELTMDLYLFTDDLRLAEARTLADGATLRVVLPGVSWSAIRLEASR